MKVDGVRRKQNPNKRSNVRITPSKITPRKSIIQQGSDSRLTVIGVVFFYVYRLLRWRHSKYQIAFRSDSISFDLLFTLKIIGIGFSFSVRTLFHTIDLIIYSNVLNHRFTSMIRLTFWLFKNWLSRKWIEWKVNELMVGGSVGLLF